MELVVSDHRVNRVDEGFDAAIPVGARADAADVARPLAPYQVIACATPAYLARRGHPRQPQDRLMHDCIGLSSASLRWRFGEHTVQAGSRLQINNGEALRQAALADGRIVQL